MLNYNIYTIYMSLTNRIENQHKFVHIAKSIIQIVDNVQYIVLRQITGILSFSVFDNGSCYRYGKSI